MTSVLEPEMIHLDLAPSLLPLTADHALFPATEDVRRIYIPITPTAVGVKGLIQKQNIKELKAMLALVENYPKPF